MIKNFGYKVIDLGGKEITTSGITVSGIKDEFVNAINSEKFIVLNGLNISIYGKIAPCSPIVYYRSNTVIISIDSTYYITIDGNNLVKLMTW